MKKKKVPGKAVGRNSKKQVKNSIQAPLGKPSWRFSTVDKNGPFSWPAGNHLELKIVGKLHSFDSMDWSEIEGSGSHLISVGLLSKDARKRLSAIKLDDLDDIFSLRLMGAERIFCIRDGNVGKLLWYDPDHKVCPSSKKHT